MTMERATRQRAAIREALEAAARPLLPDELLLAAQTLAPGLGMATVYRNLKLLVEEGELRTVALPGENLRYEVAGPHHHHHFQCRRCQRVFDVHACPGDLAGLAPAGFVVQDHELTLYGLCSECAARPARRRVAAARPSTPRSRPAP
jgi:Fur family ferric uptake transcriptional regulator